MSLLVPAKLRYRDRVGAVLNRICKDIERLGEPAGFKDQMMSAFNEAFNNAVKHGGFDGGRQDILVNIDVSRRQLVVEFLEQGSVFDPCEMELPTLDELRESGMGLHIMRSFVSRLEYEPGDRGDKANVLRLVRDLKSGEEPT